MTLVRTHYVIDLWSGLFIAHYFHIWAEKACWIADVKALGIPDKKRKRNFFKPCKCCGWSNKYAGDYISKEEKRMLQAIHQEYNPFGIENKLRNDSDEEGKTERSQGKKINPGDNQGPFTKL